MKCHHPCHSCVSFLTLEGLVLPSQSLQLLQRLFVGRLELEELAGVLPALLLTRLDLGHQLLALLPPVSELLLHDPLLFVQSLSTGAGLRDNTGKGWEQSEAQRYYIITRFNSQYGNIAVCMPCIVMYIGIFKNVFHRLRHA